MSTADGTVSEDGSRRRSLSIWAFPVAGLFGLWLWLAFSSGGYIASQWLPPSLAVGLFGLVVSLLVAYPRRPRQLSLLVLGLFGCYSLWVAFSALWAESPSRVWMESGRTFAYLLVFALAIVYLTDKSARRAFRYLLMAAAFVLLTACVWNLWTTSSIAGLFIDNRLSYPVSYPNNAAALFLVAFWPLMWLAAGSEEKAPVKGVALGLATGLLGLSIMTQSRGAIWSLAISAVVMFVVSPARLRTLFYLLVPAVLMVYEFPNLNRYWLAGPDAVGGGLGARTVALASITAAFIGMIIALLERWVNVSRRMRVIFGTIVALGVVAALVYGSITLTSDVGGPFKWISRAWGQFTTGVGASDSNIPSSAGSSRFAIVSSSNRVDIWKVAWKEFEAAPVLGVGADNFIFQYDRLRTVGLEKPQQAHSLELQVLGETGVVGGIFAFGGMLLALGGLLWPRCAAGWRGARKTWLRGRSKADSAKPPDPGGEVSAPHWGDKSIAYGWEMALLVGVVYWLIHASVDWLWQMAGVGIPALLLLAAGIASVDARAEVLWPRWNRWLRVRAPRPTVSASPGEPSGEGGSRRPRRQRGDLRLQPPGVLSLTVRALLATLSLVLIIYAGLPYLSLQIQKSAVVLASVNGVRAVNRAGAARWMQPDDPDPYMTQAGIYASAAVTAAASSANDRTGAVLDDLALSIERTETAIGIEPADWSLRYQAGVAALNLLIATDYAGGVSPAIDHPALVSLIPGLQDWSALSSSSGTPPPPGQAAGSLAATTATKASAAHYRDMPQAVLSDLARTFLGAAKERNPLASEVQEATQLLNELDLRGTLTAVN